MAEAIAIVGVLSSVLQVLEFTAKTASHAYKLINDGEEGLQLNNETERLATEYGTLGARSLLFGNDVGVQTAEEQTLSRLGSECKSESRKLLDQLEALKIDPHSRGVKRLAEGTRKAAQSLRRRKDIEKSRNHLHELNGQLSTAILQSLLSRQQNYTEPGVNALKAALETIGDNVQKVLVFSEQHQRLKRRTELVIRSLYFKEIISRWSAIEEAYAMTYQWALQDEQLRFKLWLRAGDGIFWISGKAGSGKSTLMKYLCEHGETRRVLEEWCGGCKLHFASFYFCPELAQIAFPKRFMDNVNLTSIPWTYEELAEGLKALASYRNTDGRQTRFCLFVDGLDEYNGNHMDLVTLLRSFVGNPKIKMCVSSRPWNYFRNAFESRVPTLRLEDLSRPDIWHYVNSSMQNGLAQCQPPSSLQMNGEARLLTDGIVDKAEGVFLWVVLVVKSVLRGLAEDDPIYMLRRRVQEFPANLEDFFRSILGRVDGVYKPHTSQALKLACMQAEEADSERSWVDFWFIQQHPQGLLDVNSVYDLDFQQLSANTWSNMRSKTRSMLSATCKDLLCLPKLPKPLKVQPGSVAFNKHRVDSLHRTVHDFLRTDDMQQTLNEQVPQHFKSSQILRLFDLARLKRRRSFIPVSEERRTLEKATAMFVDMPFTFRDEPYVTNFEKTVHYLRRVHNNPDWYDSAQLLIIFTAFRKNDYVLEYLDRLTTTPAKRHTPRIAFLKNPAGEEFKNSAHLIHLAAFGEDERNKFPLEHISLKLLESLTKLGLLAPLEGALAPNIIWRIFLRKWSDSPSANGSSGRLLQSESPALRHAWEVAKLLLSSCGALDEEFCVRPSEASSSDRKHAMSVAADFLRRTVPAGWLLESRHTLHLAQSGGSSSAKRRRDSADIPVQCSSKKHQLLPS